MFSDVAIYVSGKTRHGSYEYASGFHPPAFHQIARCSIFEECCMRVHISRPIRSAAPDLTNTSGTKRVRWGKRCQFPNVIEIYRFLCNRICGYDGTVADPMYF